MLADLASVHTHEAQHAHSPAAETEALQLNDQELRYVDERYALRRADKSLASIAAIGIVAIEDLFLGVTRKCVLDLGHAKASGR